MPNRPAEDVYAHLKLGEKMDLFTLFQQVEIYGISPGNVAEYIVCSLRLFSDSLLTTTIGTLPVLPCRGIQVPLSAQRHRWRDGLSQLLQQEDGVQHHKQGDDQPGPGHQVPSSGWS